MVTRPNTMAAGAMDLKTASKAIDRIAALYDLKAAGPEFTRTSLKVEAFKKARSSIKGVEEAASLAMAYMDAARDGIQDADFGPALVSHPVLILG